MSQKPPRLSAYLLPAALFTGGTALASAAGGDLMTVGPVIASVAAVGQFLANLGPNLVSNLFQKSADARAEAYDFAINDLLARAFARAVAGQMQDVAGQAGAEGDQAAAKLLRQSAEVFPESWLEQLRKGDREGLKGVDGQALAEAFSEALANDGALRLDRHVWEFVLKQAGLGDVWGAWHKELDDRWSKALLDRLTGRELPQGFLHELALDPAASRKMTLRLLTALNHGSESEAVREGLSVQDIGKLDTALKGLATELASLHTKVDELPAALVRELRKERLLVEQHTFKTDLSRILQYAPAELIGRDEEKKLLSEAWDKAVREEKSRPHILTFVALGGEGKTSLIAKWAVDVMLAKGWPGCAAAFAWSFYSQGTREQLAASSDLFLKEALTFFAEGDPKEAEIKAFAASPAGAFEKGKRLARIVGQRRCLLILDGLEPLQYAPTSPTPGQLKDQGLAALLKGLAAASHGLCVVTTRYSVPDLKAFWQTTAPEVKLLRLSREAGVHLLKTLGVKGSETRNIPFTPSPGSEVPKTSHAGPAPKGAPQASPGQRPGLTDENDPALKGRDKAPPHDGAAPTGLGADGAKTQGDALGWPVSGRWPASAGTGDLGGSAFGGTQLLNEFEKLVEDVKGHALTLTLLGNYLRTARAGNIGESWRIAVVAIDREFETFNAPARAAFRQRLVATLGIPAETVRIHEVVKGSCVIVLEFESKEAFARFVTAAANQDPRLKGFQDEWTVTEMRMVADLLASKSSAPITPIAATLSDKEKQPRMKIPNSLIYVIGDVLGEWYFSHTKLNTLFGGNGFPGEPPPGNCVHKCQEWLRRANESEESDPLALLGSVLVEFMNYDGRDDPKWQEGYRRITETLAKNGFTFDLNGTISPIAPNTNASTSVSVAALSPPTESLVVSHTGAASSQVGRSIILFLAANPDGVTKLALDKECRAIRERIRASGFPFSLELKTEWAVRPDDLLQYLNEYRPHIVHFSGHGSKNEELILHGLTDQPKPVSMPALRALFSTLKDNIRLVVLNACYSRAQAEAIVELIDCAVGMKRAIGDEAAIVFAASFYRALGFGRSVKEAFDQGCAALLLEGIPEQDTPELLVKKHVNPANVFLARTPAI